MSRDNSGTHSTTRSSALWGTGNRGGDSRGSALWGKGGRGLGAILTVLFVTAIPLAGAGKSNKQPAPEMAATYVDPVLLAKAHTTPNALVKMIIQSIGEHERRRPGLQFAPSTGDQCRIASGSRTDSSSSTRSRSRSRRRRCSSWPGFQGSRSPVMPKSSWLRFRPRSTSGRRPRTSVRSTPTPSATGRTRRRSRSSTRASTRTGPTSTEALVSSTKR